MKKTVGISLGLIGALLLVWAVVAQPPTAPPNDADDAPEKESSMADEASWAEVDRLISEQKMQAASELVAELRAAARAAGDESAWTRSLIREVQLRTSLHGYETAVRFLRDEPWPEGPVHRTVLELFYGHALVHYHRVYSWEIQQRERQVADDEVDLKGWTSAQIVAAAAGALAEAWRGRDDWGDESLGPVAEYIEQNDYPARIRGTLRDAVTYLWADLLADTSLWSAEHSNEVFRLELQTLLDDPSALVEEDALADSDAHPLARLAFVLADLERWHAANDRPEAAFEARLQRIARLAASFDQEADRGRLRADLEKHRDALGRGFPWWSMGMAQLAELVRMGSAGDALVAAREIALAGAAVFPKSLGGRRCQHIAESIAAPSYSMQGMAVDGPDRRSLAIDHANLERLHLRAYSTNMRRFLRDPRRHHLVPSQGEIEALVAKAKPVAEWQVDLPATRDFRPHRTYTTPPLSDLGFYVVVASTRADFAKDSNQLVALPLLLSDLVLTQLWHRGQPIVSVRSGASGRPLSGVELELYRRDWREGHQRLASQITGGDGRVSFPHAEGGGGSYFVFASSGPSLGSLDVYGHRSRGPAFRRSSLVFTDRSVYRPGQTVYWKVVAYHGEADPMRFQTLRAEDVQVELIDANGQRSAMASLTTNEHGSAAGEFRLPTTGLLGGWQVRTSLSGSAQIRVEEYKRPTFEIELLDPDEALRLNRPAKLTGEALYYFGLPVSEAEVAWRVTREPIYPYWWWWPRPGGVQPIAGGDTRVDADGRFEVAFTPAADERLAAGGGISYRYRLSVDLTDGGGETRSAERVFQLGFVAVDARISSPKGFFTAGEIVEVEVYRGDLDGTPRAGAADWRLVLLDPPGAVGMPAEQPLPPAPEAIAEYQTRGDRLRPRWETRYSPDETLRLWSDGDEVAAGETRHDDDGSAEIELPRLEPGFYRLHYRTRDAFGAELERQHELIVAGADGSLPCGLPALLVAERSWVEVGGKARLLVCSGLADPRVVVEAWAGEGRLVRQVLGGGSELIEVPVDRDLRGGFEVRLSLLRDHQLIELRSSISVPWTDRRLQVELASFRDLLRPGARETWRVKVRDADGQPLGAGTAEVLAYMYDRSLDLFAPHHPPDVLALYPGWRGAPGTRNNLGQASSIWFHRSGFPRIAADIRLKVDRLRFFDGYGIGGPGRRSRLQKITVTSESPLLESAAPPAPASPMAVAESMSDDAVEELQALGYTNGGDGSGSADGAPELRSDFAETAFWFPQLRLDDDGEVSFEFTVPDSLTEWSFWVHAMTHDLRGGRHEAEAKSVKELLVRPYLPRFLREGDRAELEVTVQNAAERRLAGELTFDLVDPVTEESVAGSFALAPTAAVPFAVEPGGSETLAFTVEVPPGVGEVAVRAVGRAGDLSDGELRPLPVLPGRIHLAQSRFATLHDRDRRVLRFADLAADDDATRIDERLVVTVDGQLFTGVLAALPYLVDYPYRCTEQTLNRFVSTGILAGLMDEHPALERMAAELAERETRFEAWDEPDPNRSMALEETPWLRSARGGEDTSPFELLRVLDPKVARATRDASLAELRQAQTASGAFPWWPGGPPSPYMTVYILAGLSRALEHGVEVPRDMVVRAWSYLSTYYRSEVLQRMRDGRCCLELVTFLGYVLSTYPDVSWTGGAFSDDDRREMLDFSFEHWRRHSPLIKSYLALTLHRADRGEDARLVFDSIMDSARTTDDEGTFWAPEDRAWLWYNDTVETHSFVLHALGELAPDDERRHGLVQWLFLNKKLNHWKSTRATAEAIYALVGYLESEGALVAREEATVTLGERRQTFVFEPEEYTGQARLVVAGAEIEPREDAEVVVEKETPGFLFASATWHFSTEELPAEARGDFFSVERRFFRRQQEAGEWVLRPLVDGDVLETGDQLEVQLSIRSKHAAEYVHLRDPRPAGCEPESQVSRHRWDLGLGWYEEVRDSGTNFFFERLPVGEYTLKHRLRVAHGGRFRVAPATLQSMYAPEFTAYSAGAVVTATGR